MTKQKVLIAGLATAVLCAVCLGVALGSKNAALKAQVDALAEENAALTAESEKLTKDMESLTQTNKEYADARYEANAARAAAVNKLAEAEDQLKELTVEIEMQDYSDRVELKRYQKLNEIWVEAELELAALRQTSFSDETVADALYWYYRLINGYHCTPLNILSTLGLREYDLNRWELVELTDPEGNYDLPWIGGTAYFKTDVTEEEYRTALLRYISERMMESRFFLHTVVSNGYIYILDGGASG